MRFRIVYHGAEHEQYFQGHGVAFTRYTHCATGCGSTPGEALDDALEQLATGGDVPDHVLDEIEHCSDAAEIRGMRSGCVVRDLDEGWHYYVSVDIDARS